MPSAFSNFLKSRKSTSKKKDKKVDIETTATEKGSQSTDISSKLSATRSKSREARRSTLSVDYNISSEDIDQEELATRYPHMLSPSNEETSPGVRMRLAVNSKCKSLETLGVGGVPKSPTTIRTSAEKRDGRNEEGTMRRNGSRSQDQLNVDASKNQGNLGNALSGSLEKLRKQRASSFSHYASLDRLDERKRLPPGSPDKRRLNSSSRVREKIEVRRNNMSTRSKSLETLNAKPSISSRSTSSMSKRQAGPKSYENIRESNGGKPTSIYSSLEKLFGRRTQEKTSHENLNVSWYERSTSDLDLRENEGEVDNDEDYAIYDIFDETTEEAADDADDEISYAGDLDSISRDEDDGDLSRYDDTEDPGESISKDFDRINITVPDIRVNARSPELVRRNSNIYKYYNLTFPPDVRTDSPLELSTEDQSADRNDISGVTSFRSIDENSDEYSQNTTNDSTESPLKLSERKMLDLLPHSSSTPIKPMVSPPSATSEKYQVVSVAIPSTSQAPAQSISPTRSMHTKRTVMVKTITTPIRVQRTPSEDSGAWNTMSDSTPDTTANATANATSNEQPVIYENNDEPSWSRQQLEEIEEFKGKYGDAGNATVTSASSPNEHATHSSSVTLRVNPVPPQTTSVPLACSVLPRVDATPPEDDASVNNRASERPLDGNGSPLPSHSSLDEENQAKLNEWANSIFTTSPTHQPHDATSPRLGDMGGIVSKLRRRKNDDDDDDGEMATAQSRNDWADNVRDVENVLKVDDVQNADDVQTVESVQNIDHHLSIDGIQNVEGARNVNVVIPENNIASFTSQYTDLDSSDRQKYGNGDVAGNSLSTPLSRSNSSSSFATIHAAVSPTSPRRHHTIEHSNENGAVDNVSVDLRRPSVKYDDYVVIDDENFEATNSEEGIAALARKSMQAFAAIPLPPMPMPTRLPVLDELPAREDGTISGGLEGRAHAEVSYTDTILMSSIHAQRVEVDHVISDELRDDHVIDLINVPDVNSNANSNIGDEIQWIEDHIRGSSGGDQWTDGGKLAMEYDDEKDLNSNAEDDQVDVDEEVDIISRNAVDPYSASDAFDAVETSSNQEECSSQSSNVLDENNHESKSVDDIRIERSSTDSNPQQHQQVCCNDANGDQERQLFGGASRSSSLRSSMDEKSRAPTTTSEDSGYFEPVDAIAMETSHDTCAHEVNADACAVRECRLLKQLTLDRMFSDATDGEVAASSIETGAEDVREGRLMKQETLSAFYPPRDEEVIREDDGNYDSDNDEVDFSHASDDGMLNVTNFELDDDDVIGTALDELSMNEPMESSRCDISIICVDSFILDDDDAIGTADDDLLISNSDLRELAALITTSDVLASEQVANIFVKLSDVYGQSRTDEEDRLYALRLGEEVYWIVTRTDTCRFIDVINRLLALMGLIKSENVCRAINTRRLLEYLTVMLNDTECFHLEYVTTFACFLTRRAADTISLQVRSNFLRACFEREVLHMHEPVEVFALLCHYFIPRDKRTAEVLVDKWLLPTMNDATNVQFTSEVLAYIGLIKSEQRVRVCDDIESAFILFEYVAEQFEFSPLAKQIFSLFLHKHRKRLESTRAIAIVNKFGCLSLNGFC